MSSVTGGTPEWQAGVARALITPERPLWLSGYGSRRLSDGRRHDLWIKALALRDGGGNRAVLVTSDLVGLSKPTYDRLCAAVEARHGLDRSQLLLTCSHNHSAPVTTGVLPDYYPLEAVEWAAVEEYSSWLEGWLLDTVAAALREMRPARLSAAEGRATFAVNRRNNRETEVADRLARCEPLQGPVDHSVPLLAVRSPDDDLLAVVLGYACHPTTLSDTQWCGDYPGYAQVEIERAHPGAMALFWTGCGGDQNPLPRRSVELCERYGRALAAGVEEALGQPGRELEPEIRTAFEIVRLDFERHPTRADVEAAADGSNTVRARWAARIRGLMDSGHPFEDGCDYGVQAWRLGDQLWIALGAEAVVDYSLRFKQEYGPGTWVAGYAHDMVGYVPSRRVWNEGGYEGGYLYEYGWLAERWTADTEDRIGAAVERLARKVGAPIGN